MKFPVWEQCDPEVTFTPQKTEDRGFWPSLVKYDHEPLTYEEKQLQKEPVTYIRYLLQPSHQKSIAQSTQRPHDIRIAVAFLSAVGKQTLRGLVTW